MLEVRTDALKFTNLFLSVAKNPVIVIALVLAVSGLCYAGIKLMTLNRADERAEILQNIKFTVIGVILTGVYFPIIGYLATLILKG